MSDLRELYQEVVIDHGRRPRNFRQLDPASHHAEGFNPLCGDRLTLYLKLDGGVIREASFQGSGCAISMASASLMTEHLKGKTAAEAEAIFRQFHHLLTEDAEGDTDKLGKLTVLAGVKEFPTRVKCATLAWHTLHAALENEQKPVSTE
jgi:nitrogen fixation NifU-like protein